MASSSIGYVPRYTILSACTILVLGLPATHGLCSLLHLSSANPLNVSWDAARKECSPAVCKGIDLQKIPDVSGYLPANLACKMRLYDSDSAIHCLAGKYVVALGDSTVTEMVYDMVMLMAGLGANPVALNDFVRNATRQRWPHTQIFLPMDGLPQPHEIQLDFYGNQRNMTVMAKTKGLLIRHRFTGHVDVTQNMLGLETFFHPDFQDEFNCLLQPGLGCAPKRPDILIVNSGLHDANMPTPKFAENMRILAQRLRAIADKGILVVWRGNNSMRKTHGMDIISRHYLEAEGIPFVDTRAIMEHFKDMLATGCCSDLKVSNGQHIGAIAKFHNESSRLTVSSMVTQGVLGSICVPEPGSAALPAL